MKGKSRLLVLLAAVSALCLIGLAACGSVAKVTFDLNYEGAPAAVTVEAADGKVALPEAPTRSGYVFGGWFTDAACTAAFDENAVTESVTVYAKWTVAAFTVTFNYNYEGAPEATRVAVENGGIVVKPADPARTGYIFGGWFTDAACVSAFDDTAKILADATVYAKWTAAVTFDYNYENAPAAKVVAVGADGKVVKPADPGRTGYGFGGWFTDKTYQTAFDLNAAYTAPATAYAKWLKVNQVTYALGYETEEVPPVQSDVKTEGSFVTAAAPVREGYTFLGWKYGNGETDVIAAGETFTLDEDGDVTLTAVWEIKTFTVSFYAPDSSLIASQTVEYGKPATAPDMTAYARPYYGIVWDVPFNDIRQNTTATFAHVLQASEDKYFTFKEAIAEDGTEGYTVAASSEPMPDTLVLPVTYNGKPVFGITPGTSAATSAFGKKGVKTVFIPNGYTEIAAYAFYNNSTNTDSAENADPLCGVIFDQDSTVTEIGKYAFAIGTSTRGFSNINHLTSIEIPAAVETIGTYAFMNRGELETVTFEAGSRLKTIESSAFRMWESSSDANIANVGEWAKLSGITIPKTVTTIGNEAFLYCKRLASLNFEPGGTQPLTIGKSAFANTFWEKLPESPVTIPNRVESIGNTAFAQSLKLAYTFEAGEMHDETGAVVTLTIGDGAFTGYYSGSTYYTTSSSNISKIKPLAATTLTLPARTVKVGKAAFAHAAFTSVTIPEALSGINRTIGDYAFAYGYNGTENPLTTISLPDDLTAIPNYMFSGYSNPNFVNKKVTSIKIPDSVTTIGTSAFSYFTGLTELNLGSHDGSALAIGGSAFVCNTTFANTKITTLAMPNRVKSIISNAFQYWTALTSVTFQPTSNCETLTGCFKNTGITEFMFPQKVTTVSDCLIGSPLTTVTISKNVTNIAANAFKGISTLTSVIFEEGGTADLTIGDNAFAGVFSPNSGWIIGEIIEPVTTKMNLREVKLPARVKSIGIGAFAFNDKLTAFTIEDAPQGVTPVLKAIDGDIYNAAGNTFVLAAPGKERTADANGYYVLGEGVLEIANGAFYGNMKIAKLDLNGVTKAGNSAFSYMTELTSVKLGALAEAGTKTFDHCNKLTAVDFGVAPLAVIADYMFAYCIQLADITLPATVTTLNANCFQACAFTSFVLPESITTLNGDYQFADTKLMTSFTFNTKATEVTAWMFQRSGIKTLVLPANITTINKYAFNGCKVDLLTVEKADGLVVANSSAFSGATITSIVVPTAELAEQYKAASVWSTKASVITAQPAPEPPAA